jgi:hypothetical protein
VQLCVACGEKEMATKSRFCDVHKRAYDTMRWQAKKASKEDDFNKIMGNPTKMQLAILDFCKENPADQKFMRKTKIDWHQWLQTYGSRLVKREGDKEKPFTRAALQIYLTSKQGWTPTEAESEWEKCIEDPSVDRDMLGKGGEQRIWYNLGPRQAHCLCLCFALVLVTCFAAVKLERWLSLRVGCWAGGPTTGRSTSTPASARGRSRCAAWAPRTCCSCAMP